jgi:hypothetical protein
MMSKLGLIALLSFMTHCGDETDQCSKYKVIECDLTQLKCNNDARSLYMDRCTKDQNNNFYDCILTARVMYCVCNEKGGVK